MFSVLIVAAPRGSSNASDLIDPKSCRSVPWRSSTPWSVAALLWLTWSTFFDHGMWWKFTKADFFFSKHSRLVSQSGSLKSKELKFVPTYPTWIRPVEDSKHCQHKRIQRNFRIQRESCYDLDHCKEPKQSDRLDRPRPRCTKTKAEKMTLADSKDEGSTFSNRSPQIEIRCPCQNKSS